MPDDASQTVRTFTETEAYALVADNVQRETAAAQQTIETLTSEKAQLQSQLDVAEAALATEKAAKEQAVADLEAYKSQVETEKAHEARKDGRVAKVRETAKHLKDDFFTAERASRWAAMEDAAFDAYIAELAELSTGVVTSDGPPRETAMQGKSIEGASKGGSLLGSLLTGPKGA